MDLRMYSKCKKNNHDLELSCQNDYYIIRYYIKIKLLPSVFFYIFSTTSSSGFSLCINLNWELLACQNTLKIQYKEFWKVGKKRQILWYVLAINLSHFLLLAKIWEERWLRKTNVSKWSHLKVKGQEIRRSHLGT